MPRVELARFRASGTRGERPKSDSEPPEGANDTLGRPSGPSVASNHQPWFAAALQPAARTRPNPSGALPPIFTVQATPPTTPHPPPRVPTLPSQHSSVAKPPSAPQPTVPRSASPAAAPKDRGAPEETVPRQHRRPGTRPRRWTRLAGGASRSPRRQRTTARPRLTFRPRMPSLPLISHSSSVLPSSELEFFAAGEAR